MVSLSRKAHRALSILRWQRPGRREAGSKGAAFVGPVAGEGAALRRAIVVQSHRRSGTHFLIDTLRTRFPVARDWFHLEEDFYARLLSAPVVLKSHDSIWREKLSCETPWGSFLHWVAASACHDAAFHIHIMRNPRDVLRSLYFFDLKGHEERHRIAPETDFCTYIATPSSRDPEGRLTPVEVWCAHIAGWLATPRVLQVRYEDLLAAPETEVARIADFTDLAAHPARWRDSSAIGRQTSARVSRISPAEWTDREEDHLLSSARRFGLPDIGYGLAVAGQSATGT